MLPSRFGSRPSASSRSKTAKGAGRCFLPGPQSSEQLQVQVGDVFGVVAIVVLHHLEPRTDVAISRELHALEAETHNDVGAFVRGYVVLAWNRLSFAERE